MSTSSNTPVFRGPLSPIKNYAYVIERSNNKGNHMFNLTQAAAVVKQYARALTGDNVKLGDVIRVNASAGGGHAVVLHIKGTTMHVTGFYTDGTRWHDHVDMKDARHATPYQIDKLVKVASMSGYELELINRELAANIEEAACLEMAIAV